MKNSNSEKCPIAIGGCGRSGTSILLQLISSHENIFGIPEETSALCRGYYGANALKECNVGGVLVHEIEEGYDLPPGKRWCEKTPKNIVNFQKIYDEFGGDIKLIQIVRDGRDVILSRHMDFPDNYYVEPFRWVLDVSAGVQYLDKDYVLTVKYEQLVLNPEHTMKIVCEFIGEDYDPRMLDPEEHATIKIFEGQPKVRNIDAHSLGKWKNPEFEKRIGMFMEYPGVDELMKLHGYI